MPRKAGRLITLATTTALLLGAGVVCAGTASAAYSYQYCAKYSVAEPELSYGDTGAAVKELQCELNANVTGADLKVDGIFGGLTYNAVIKFQGCFSLKQDGIVGPQTWHEMDGVSDFPVKAERLC
ncbi:peptidoglycan-binding domain-containing protein [Streptomyces beihaiensis]|uniref:Peptidoglycan-binding protein n=1 Tax=Streptomyces beihaiensis TaxID=2984495 RepID=A0ABT3U424_9ACTN|nr:peptidoglycan-binding domain-containing protein [Streptomyces beihaiensis]MCX3064082.1 peptidoglycan-binding protein [Streptomyces beihaiensis]